MLMSSGLRIAAFLRSLRSQDGQSMVEYALIIALVAVVVIGAVLALGHGIGNIFTNITSNL